jgi:hypothetical protein
MLREILESKGEEVTGEWRKWCNKELCALYRSSNIVGLFRANLMIGVLVALIGEKNAYRALVGKLEESRLRGRRDDNIKIDLINLISECEQDLAGFVLGKWGNFVNTVMNLEVAQNARNVLTS